MSEKPRRKAVSKKTRFEVFKRDGFKCMYCGAHPPAVMLHLDHVNPVALGGINHTDNYVTACEPCNLGKGATPLSAVPQSLADKAAETKEREDQIKGYQAVMADVRGRIEMESRKVLHVLDVEFFDDAIPRDWRRSTNYFVETLGFDACLQSMERAVSKCRESRESAFRYFCGTCWSKLREAQGAT